MRRRVVAVRWYWSTLDGDTRFMFVAAGMAVASGVLAIIEMVHRLVVYGG